ncbi:hypothetical protein [Kitasatospora sp. NPDC002040]|uniref:hypothetical protein n=1 Tax=Kitasatospora sp. NPDC002040 TaxID=3154661 RepID=UPI0033225530
MEQGEATVKAGSAIEAGLVMAIDSYDREGARRERRAWKDLSFEEALDRACLGRTANGSPHTHFQQVLWETRRSFLDVLFPIVAELEAIEGFEPLYNRLDEVGMKVPKVNTSRRRSVIVYDVAFALAANRGFKPGGVYLHSNPGRAARALGLRPEPGKKFMLRKRLPQVPKRYPAWQVEDILCEAWKLQS